MPAEEPPRLSGTLVRGLLDAASEVLGEEVVQRGLAAAPPDAREHVVHAVAGGWVLISEVEAAFTCMAVAAERDIESLHAQLARVSVGRALRTLWRMLLRLTTDEALVSRTPIIFSKSYDRGQLISRVTAPGRGEVQLIDWPDAPEWTVRGTRLGIEIILEVAGRRNVYVDGRRTSTGALYSATWKP